MATGPRYLAETEHSPNASMRWRDPGALAEKPAIAGLFEVGLAEETVCWSRALARSTSTPPIRSLPLRGLESFARGAPFQVRPPAKTATSASGRSRAPG